MRSLISSAVLAAVALSVSVESLSHSKFHNIEFNLDKRSTPDTWRQVTSIYQVMTDRFARTDGSTTASCDVTKNDYCGGTWQGIIKQLPYIQGMGHDAIWISPVPENLDKGYHGYWTKNIYSLNSNFGTADDLKQLSQALHDKQMYLMVDVAVNNMGVSGPEQKVDFSQYVPFNDPKYFHSFCNIMNYGNQTEVENCWLAGLPDLRTEDADVRNVWYPWVKDLVANYSIDGLRVDALKHVKKDFWADFEKSSGVYNFGECYDGDASYTCAYQQVMSGVANYPLLNQIVATFNNTSTDFSPLIDEMKAISSSCKDPTLITNFLENADISRWNTNTFDISLTKNAIAFIMLNDGIPIIYQGQEQNFTGKFDPQNRAAVWFSKYNTDSELYKHIAAINKLRRQAIANSAQYTISPTSVIFADASTMAMQKGPDNNNNVLTVLNKAGQDAADHTFTIPESRFQPGQVLVDIIGCNSVTVGDKGSIKSTIKYGHPQVFYPSAGLKGTGICSADKDIAPSASSTPGSPSGKTTSAAGRTTIGASLAGLLAVSAVAMAL